MQLKYHKPYQTPLNHYHKSKEEVDRLEKLCIIERDCNSKHAAPYFVQPKSDKTIWFLTDFRELNKKLIQNLFLLPRIDEMLQSLGKFAHASKLDLSMGHYHFSLGNLAKELATISLPWGNCHYNCLSIEIMTSVDMFQ